jgi:hypothetical protein
MTKEAAIPNNRIQLARLIELRADFWTLILRHSFVTGHSEFFIRLSFVRNLIGLIDGSRRRKFSAHV